MSLRNAQSGSGSAIRSRIGKPLEKKFGQSTPSSNSNNNMTTPASKNGRRAALGEVSNTVKARPRSGTGSSFVSAKPKQQSLSLGSQLQQPQAQAQPPPEVEKMREMESDLETTSSTTSNVFVADRIEADVEGGGEIDDNYPEPERMGLTDHDLCLPPMWTEVIKNAISGDVEHELPFDHFEVRGFDMYSIAEEVDISPPDSDVDVPPEEC